MGYTHTQFGKLHRVVYLFILVFVVCAFWQRDEPFAVLVILVAAAFLGFLGATMAQMTVRDEGDALALVYGPVPLFRRRIPYSSMRTVRLSRSKLIDGLGIHFVPWRGWTYNLWGFDCAEVHCQRGTIRIGSDDAENLVRFLERRLGGADS
jgi:hypothetical protein